MIKYSKKLIDTIMCKINVHSWYLEVSYQGDGIISMVSKCSKCGAVRKWKERKNEKN